MEAQLGRVVNLHPVGKDRNQLMKMTAIAIRELNTQQEVTQETKDLAAFIALSLFAISATIDRSVEPWEKRGYWLKADRFRMDWAWSSQLGERMRIALLADDWAGVALTIASITGHDRPGPGHLPSCCRLPGSFAMLWYIELLW